MTVTIYHNPACGTSRNTLGLIRNAGIEPTVIEYLKEPPTRSELVSLIDRMGIRPRELLRQKGTPYAELGLSNPDLTDDQLIDAMMEHPILINRPVVVTSLGVKLCRPSEDVLDILPQPQRGAFRKEDGELVIDESGTIRYMSPASARTLGREPHELLGARLGVRLRGRRIRLARAAGEQCVARGEGREQRQPGEVRLQHGAEG